MDDNQYQFIQLHLFEDMIKMKKEIEGLKQQVSYLSKEIVDIYANMLSLAHKSLDHKG